MEATNAVCPTEDQPARHTKEEDTGQTEEKKGTEGGSTAADDCPPMEVTQQVAESAEAAEGEEATEPLPPVAVAADVSKDGAGDPQTQPDLNTRLFLAESELRLRREQEASLRGRLGEASLWAAEAARLLGAERRKGEVKGAALAALEGQHRDALKAAEELRQRLDSVAAERDAHARSAALLKDEVDELKQQLQMQGHHLTCQLDLENAAVKYQGKIKEYLLRMCRHLRFLEEEQETLKKSITEVSTMNEKMQKGLNHYVCKENLWLEDKKDLEKKIIDLGAQMETANIRFAQENAERNKCCDNMVGELKKNLKNEEEKVANFKRKIELMQCTELNYERKIEDFVHQIHDKTKKIDTLEKERADLENRLKHNEREMEIIERKHKYELDYALQKPLSFSCETQTDFIDKNPPQTQENPVSCATCCGKKRNMYQKRRVSWEDNISSNFKMPSSMISIPNSQSMEESETDPFLTHCSKPLTPFFTIPTSENDSVIEHISLNSLGLTRESNHIQWYTRRNEVSNNKSALPLTTNQSTTISTPIDKVNVSYTAKSKESVISSSLKKSSAVDKSNTAKNLKSLSKEPYQTETDEMISIEISNNSTTKNISSVDISDKKEIPDDFKMTDEELASLCLPEISQSVPCEDKTDINISNSMTQCNVTSVLNSNFSSSSNHDITKEENDLEKVLQKPKRRVLKVLH